MKRHEIFFSISKIPLDFFVMLGSFLLASSIRSDTQEIFWISLWVQVIPLERLLEFAFIGSMIYILVFAIHRLYQIRISQSKLEEIFSIVRYSLYWFFFFAVGVYLWNGILYQWWEIPRLILLYTTFFACIWSIIVRIFLNWLQSWLTRLSILQKRNLILVSDISLKKLQPILQDIERSWIYHISGYIWERKNTWYPFTFLSEAGDYENIFQTTQCDEILYIQSDLSEKKRYKLWESAHILWIRYRYITNNFDITKTNTTLSLIHKIPVLEILNTPLQNWNRILKRICDILFSLTGIILFFPLGLIIALLIKIEDPEWPIIYKNLRIGQGGRKFDCYKFRYMYWKYCIKEWYWISVDHDPAFLVEQKLIESKNTRHGPLYKIGNDPRRTKVGIFLEKYSLDELPQFFNVLFGDMSIVGPRPHQPREVEKYQKYQKRLLTVKPGMTGMAQVHGREKNSFHKEAELDLFYIENWSILLDFKIILKTLSYILTRK